MSGQTFGGHSASEVAELCDILALSADGCNANSYSEIASICRRASSAIRYLIAQLAEVESLNGQLGLQATATTLNLAGLLAAAKNLENDDGSIPAHAWGWLQAAIACAEGRTP